MTEREALKLALDSLICSDDFLFDYHDCEPNNEHEQQRYDLARTQNRKSIESIKEILAQPEHELLAWKNAALRVGEDLSSVGPKGYYNMTAQQWLDWAMAQQPRGNNSLAQPEQEPVAWMKKMFSPELGEFFDYKDGAFARETDCQGWTPLYTTPPQRTWFGLTDDEVFDVWLNEMPAPDKVFYQKLCRSVEAKLKHKNGYAEENT